MPNDVGPDFAELTDQEKLVIFQTLDEKRALWRMALPQPPDDFQAYMPGGPSLDNMTCDYAGTGSRGTDEAGIVLG